MMLFASCQQENLEPAAQESTVTFSVELPGVQTKTIGDGFNVDQLVYEVWKTEGENERDLKDTQNATRLYQEKATMARIGDEQKTVISLNLVHDQNYTILFWAQNSKAIDNNEPAYNTTDLTAVTYAKKLRDENFNNGEYLSNNENMAAFYGTAFIKAAEVEIPSTRRVELRRPFAQLNIGTMNTPKEYTVTMNQSRVKISNVPSVFDVAQNIGADSKKGIEAEPAVSDTLAFVFEYAALPEDPSKLKVNDIEYDYVAMNYIFADGNVDVQYWIDATLTAVNPTEGRNETTNAVVYNRVPQVPLKENYRTNIVGNLLTSTTQYEVVIDASWEDVNEKNWDGNVEEVWDENYIQEPYFNAEKNQYEISLASELAWLAAKVNGMPYIDAATNSVKYEAPVKFAETKFVLVEDIDLVGEDGDELIWTPIGATGEFQGIFDGQGHTISNLVVRSEGTIPAGLFGKVKSATVKNVTVVDADVQVHGSAAVIVAHGVCAKIENCHVEGATVVSTPYEKDDANNVGAIIGYLDGDSGVGHVTGCTVTDAEITAYRKVGGIVGSANQQATVSGNTVENTTITSDQIPAYKTEEDGNAGPVVGYKHSAATIGEGQEGENVTVIRRVDSTKELEHAVADAQSGDTIYISGEVTMPYFTDKALNFEGITKSAIVKQSAATHIDEFYKGAELNFKNLTLVGTEYKNDTQGYQKAVKETYEDCNFENYIMFAGDVTTVDNCVFTGKYNSYFWTATANNITFNECEFNGVERIVKVCTVGNPGERTVTFNDCTFTATEQKKAAIEIDGTKGSSYKVYINRCTESGFAPGEFTGETMFNIEGMENVEVYVNGELWQIVDPNTVNVSNLEELLKWAYMANNGQNALNLNLLADITLPAFEIVADDANQTYKYTETPITVDDGTPTGSNWVPVGNTSVKYSGMINGNGHTITGLRINDITRGYIGFVGVIDGGSNMEEAVNYENIYIENLGFDGAVVYTTKSVSGVVAGYVRNIKSIKNCVVRNSTISGNTHTGGVVGYLYTRESDNNVVLSDSSTETNTKVNGGTHVGGLVGYNYGSIITNCENNAEVKGTGDYVGGITGYTRDYHHNRSSYIIACRNNGNVTSTSKLVGGIAGYNLYDAGHQNGEACVVACSSTARVISGSKDVALLVGKSYANSGTVINDCHYGSWALITPTISTLVNGGETHGCYAFDPTAEVTEAEVNAMNAAIDQYNIGRAADDPTFCPYKWTWTEGNQPVLQ